jgi:hypothetical protein
VEKEGDFGILVSALLDFCAKFVACPFSSYRLAATFRCHSEVATTGLPR